MLGLGMLAAVFFLGFKWGGFRRGLISLLLLAGMPQFFRYSHWILVDIGVGSLCTIALSLFAWWFFWPAEKKVFQQTRLCLFYLACAFAFLTKGLVACFHVFVVTGFFFLVCLILGKGKDRIHSFFSWRALLFFIVPVGLWVFLLWNEGGICYLHEHFINNILGRFLHRHFELSGCHFYHTDIGNTSPWYRYLERLPDMIGVTYLVLPLAVWNAFKGPKGYESHEKGELQPLFNIFLTIWTFLPGIILSFAAQKEVSYLLPSYSGAALFAGGWIDSRLSSGHGNHLPGLFWTLLVVPVSLATFFLPGIMNTRDYMFVTGGFIALFIPLLFYFFLKKRYCHAVFLGLAIQLGAVTAGNTPEVIFHTRLHAKTYGEMAKYIQNMRKKRDVYLFQPDDYLRGSISFYNNILTPELDRTQDVLKQLSLNTPFFILGEQDKINSLEDLSAVSAICSLPEFPDFHYKAKYSILFCNKDNHTVKK